MDPKPSDRELRVTLERDPKAELDLINDALPYDKKASAREMLAYMDFVGDQKTKVLLEAGDTTIRNNLATYLAIAESIGFKTVLEIPFVGKGWDDKPCDEKMIFMWRASSGILLAFDTFTTTEVNSGHFYYNWVANNDQTPGEVMGNGRSHGEVLAGDHDCREALMFNIRQLEKHGKFLPKWIALPHLWLIHHADKVDWRDGSSSIINAERVAMLPIEVREAMMPK